MADEGQGKNQDELRVVEETAEDVVRLEVPEVKALEKKGKIIGLAPEQPKANADEPVIKSALADVDPEGEWQAAAKESNDRSIPMGWFALLGVLLLGVFAWAMLQSKPEEVSGESVSLLGDAVEVDLGGPDETVSAASRQDAAAHFARTEDVVRKFLAAGSVEERLKYVRHPKRILPLMKSHYETHPFRQWEFESVDEYHIVVLDHFPFLALSIKTAEGEELPVLVEDGSDELLVDWESFVCYQPMDPEDFLAQRPTEPVSLRVYAQPDSFFAHEFSEESEYVCFQLTFRHSDEFCFGYVKRDTLLFQKFRKLLADGVPWGQRAFILRVRFLEGSKATRSVLIEELESKLWAYPVDPSQSAESGQDQ